MAAGPGRRSSYGSRLREELGLTPRRAALQHRPPHLRQRPRAGRPARGPGGRWPVEVERDRAGRALDGRAGGARGCHQAAERGDDWVGRVRHVVSLGSPHMGAPLAQGVTGPARRSRSCPRRARSARFLRRRSAGIRDLRQGSLVDADWRDCDPDALRAEACAGGPAAGGRDPLLRGRDDLPNTRHPCRRLIGDFLVLAGQRARGAAAPGASRSRPSTACDRRDPPHRAAQPSRGLRPAAGLAGRLARARRSGRPAPAAGGRAAGAGCSERL